MTAPSPKRTLQTRPIVTAKGLCALFRPLLAKVTQNAHIWLVRAERIALVPLAGTILNARACPSLGYF